jgi:hypothetical protein
LQAREGGDRHVHLRGPDAVDGVAERASCDRDRRLSMTARRGAGLGAFPRVTQRSSAAKAALTMKR